MAGFLRQGTYQARAFRACPTPAEHALWQLLRGRALGAKFRRQHPIGPYVVDFFCYSAGLVIELDGSVHDSPRAHHRDQAREQLLELMGLRVMRLRNEVVLDEPDRAIALIREELAELESRTTSGEERATHQRRARSDPRAPR